MPPFAHIVMFQTRFPASVTTENQNHLRPKYDQRPDGIYPIKISDLRAIFEILTTTLSDAVATECRLVRAANCTYRYNKAVLHIEPFFSNKQTIVILNLLMISYLNMSPRK